MTTSPPLGHGAQGDPATPLRGHETPDEAGPSVRVRARPPREGDRAFILHSWQKNLRLSDQLCRESSRGFHAIFVDRVTHGVLADDATRFLVLCLEEDVDEIVGWIAYAPGSVPTVHFAYVRPRTRDGRALRRGGLFFTMLHLAGVRDRMVYTFKPAERSHPQSDDRLGVERALLDAATKRGISAVFRPVGEYLGRGARSR